MACKKFVNLALIQNFEVGEKYIGHTLQTSIEEVRQNRESISTEDILKKDEGEEELRLVFIEGAPGIGKSTLSWELCRKWKEYSYMKHYDLVILLRLREKKVQKISSVGDLFYSYANDDDREFFVKEIKKLDGNNILFILDGFDELPKNLQQSGFLYNLIGGEVLSASTIIVTSRPSATAILLANFRSQIGKHIEILGFTEEQVRKCAQAAFKTNPLELNKFESYINASKNPAINSLMRIPLNAAIIIEIFKGRKSDSFLPYTLTELYVELCLTYIKTYGPQNISAPTTLHELANSPLIHDKFLKLAKIAFLGQASRNSGGENGLVFYNLTSDLNNTDHFGLLDKEQALYGGAKASYSFVHLTVQEFFAAYHISQSDSNGPNVFKQYGTDEQWNIVWRFVAGLTKFRNYGNILSNSSVFINTQFSGPGHELSLFFIRCVIEAQTMQYFNLSFRHNSSVFFSAKLEYTSWTSFDMYALGFAITHFPPGVFLHIEFTSGKSLASFLSGLSKADAEPRLEHITCLYFDKCDLSDDDVIALSSLMPLMTNLKEFGIQRMALNKHVVLPLLQNLKHCPIATLSLLDTKFCEALSDSEVFWEFSDLIKPETSTVKQLVIGDSSLYFPVNWTINSMKIALLPSSLSNFTYIIDVNPYISNLVNSTSLTNLKVSCNPSMDISSELAEILKYNGALQQLHVHTLIIPEQINAVETIVAGLQRNRNLTSLELGVDVKNSSIDLSDLMNSKYGFGGLDSRITWKKMPLFVFM